MRLFTVCNQILLVTRHHVCRQLSIEVMRDVVGPRMSKVLGTGSGVVVLSQQWCSPGLLFDSFLFMLVFRVNAHCPMPLEYFFAQNKFRQTLARMHFEIIWNRKNQNRQLADHDQITPGLAPWTLGENVTDVTRFLKWWAWSGFVKCQSCSGSLAERRTWGPEEVKGIQLHWTDTVCIVYSIFYIIVCLYSIGCFQCTWEIEQVYLSRLQFAKVHSNSKVESSQQTRAVRLFCQGPAMFVRSILTGSNRVHCATR